MLSNGNWQDYRGKGEGVLIHLDCSPKHLLPVREPVDAHNLPTLDPSYETGTYGFLQCHNSKTRLATMKNRRRYFLFGTRYQGLAENHQGNFLIIGYMRLDKILEVRKRHVHKWMETKQAGAPAPECMDMDQCYAFQSDEMNFYAPDDAFELSEAIMKKWGYKGKVTKQMKLSFTEDKLQIILDHFKGKSAKNQEYGIAAKELEEALAISRENAAPTEDVW